MDVSETDYVRGFNIYRKIYETSLKLYSPYIVFTEDRKNVARELKSLFDEFDMTVPEEVSNSITGIPAIKAKCLEVLAVKEE